MSYFRSAIDTMASYVPGEQPLPGADVVKLNTNENPYPPSPQVMTALHQLDSESLRRYPDPFASEFCRAVSDTFAVPADWVIVGNGSDDLLNVLIRACTEGQERRVVYPTPTYVLYRTLSAMQPASVTEIPYSENFQLPVEQLIAANGAITFIASPNSPSGHVVPLQDLREIARGVSGVVVVDEAYVDFAEYSALPLVQEFENLIVLRTLSKGYSLAGLRIGFGVANPRLLSGLFKVKDSYNIDAIAVRLGTVAIRDQAYKDACVAKVKASRTKLTTDLRTLGFTVLDSHGNFVLATPPNGKAASLYRALKARGILVRYFNQPGLDDKLRISVGTEDQNEILLQTLSQLINHD
ncbi:MAG: histidinol-phosphate transaminase [Cyanobacteria bacterium P01_H01_bin.58]